jgi:hypothetical protein
MFETHRILRSPDAPEGGGGAAPTQPSTPEAAGGAGAAGDAQPQQTPPAAQPGRTISDEEYRRLTDAANRARSHDAFYTKMSELGIKKTDDALSALADWQRLQGDPQTKGILEALARPQAQPESTQEPITQDTIRQMMTDFFSQHEQQRLQADYESRLAQEQTLISDAVQSERLKPLFGDASFDDAFAGKATPIAKAASRLLSEAMFDRAPEINGRKMPVTDSATLNAAVDDVMETLKAVRAATILEMSRSTPGLERPGETGRVQTEAERTTVGDLAETRRQAHEFVQAEAERLAREGSPVSQL